MKTRIKVEKDFSIISSLNFSNFVIPSEGFSGGIWLIWKESLNLILILFLLKKDSFAVKLMINKTCTLATFMYLPSIFS